MRFPPAFAMGIRFASSMFFSWVITPQDFSAGNQQSHSVSLITQSSCSTLALWVLLYHGRLEILKALAVPWHFAYSFTMAALKPSSARFWFLSTSNFMSFLPTKVWFELELHHKFTTLDCKPYILHVRIYWNVAPMCMQRQCACSVEKALKAKQRPSASSHRKWASLIAKRHFCQRQLASWVDRQAASINEQGRSTSSIKLQTA